MSVSEVGAEGFRTFPPGTLVTARGRDWVVLPESYENLLMVRPLGGTDEEVTGICLDFEQVAQAKFSPPTTKHPGDHRSGRLLRDAIRLGFRSGGGPFRSFGRLAFDPRPYQLVPLLLALRQSTVRLLIADDVGIGKTVEAGLIARELLDRGEIRSLSILCLPHLVEQWQNELREKFHIDAVAVKPATADRLERGCIVGESLFDHHPFTVVSIDFIKSDRWRPKFLAAGPQLVIVDEAHVCAGTGSEARHQRHKLLEAIAGQDKTHLILVTATPHSGSENSFRELLSWLNPDFRELPDDLSGEANEKHRRAIALHLVQRKRGDITRYLGETSFPVRTESEVTYALTSPGRKLLDKVLQYSRELVREPGLNRWHKRIRWWSALALLRGLSSSPAAAAATLRKRAGIADCAHDRPDEVDQIGAHDLLDWDGDGDDPADIMPGADLSEQLADAPSSRKRLLGFAKEAEALSGKKDPKIQSLLVILEKLLADGFHPIVFCRFIPTAHYVTEQIRSAMKNVAVTTVTGETVPEERQIKVERLMEEKKRILVCTDCLSEGINLQYGFNATVHYDLSWNPTRHEQREGRVDRFGQTSKEVRVATLYGSDNPVDGMILDVLLRKHKSIRASLGVSVPMPGNTEKLVEALFESLLLREEQSRGNAAQGRLFDLDPSQLITVAHEMVADWDRATNREKRSQTYYAQQSVKPEEVEAELKRVRDAIGAGVDLEQFVAETLREHGAPVTERHGIWRADLTNCPQSLREAMDTDQLRFCFAARPVGNDEAEIEVYTRTHPHVERLSAWVMNAALDPYNTDCAVRRCGVVRTRRVKTRTTLLLLRIRMQLVRGDKRLLAEECKLAAFTGTHENPSWLTDDEVLDLLETTPDGNVEPEMARDTLEKSLKTVPLMNAELNRLTERQGDELLVAHAKVRNLGSRDARRGAPLAANRVETQTPPDILGLYVYLPMPGQMPLNSVHSSAAGGC